MIEIGGGGGRVTKRVKDAVRCDVEPLFRGQQKYGTEQGGGGAKLSLLEVIIIRSGSTQR